MAARCLSGRSERGSVLTAVLAPLLGKLFVVLALGAFLRVRLRQDASARAATRVNRVVVDAAMPLLLLLVLWRARLDLRVAEVLFATTIGQGVTCALALLLARALALPRPAQGAAAMTTTFSNTGFLGFPVLIALFGADAQATSTAVIVDAFSTTVLLWSAGVLLAARFGSGRPFSARGLVRALVRPLTAAVTLGFALSFAGVPPPGLPGAVIDGLGALVSAMVFLSLGLSLDLRAVRARALPLLAMASLKLVVMPAVVLGVVMLLDVHPIVTAAAVLQCAMPSAMVSVIIAADEGCDRAFAAGVAALSTLLCVVTLPLVGVALGAVGLP